MNRARQIALTLTGHGMLGDVNQVEKVIEELTNPDYIPGGGPVRSVDSEIMSAPIDTRCGVAIGNDVQSGPYYCGEPATLCFVSGKNLACACSKHENALRVLAARLKK